jgi:hypothetical protein
MAGLVDWGTNTVHRAPRTRALCAAAKPAFPPEEETRCKDDALCDVDVGEPEVAVAAAAAALAAKCPIPLVLKEPDG